MMPSNMCSIVFGLLTLVNLFIADTILVPESSNICDCDTERDSNALVFFSIDSGIDWDKSMPFARWEGVYTNAEGCVDSLILSNKGLSGDISPLTNLSCLEVLDLSFNQFRTGLDEDIRNWQQLRVLNLESNDFREYLLEPLGSLTKVEILNLRGAISRSTALNFIPASIGQLSNLKYLDLSSCSLWKNGVPKEIGNLSNLEYLNLSDNNLPDGMELPNEIGRLTKLKTLLLRAAIKKGKKLGYLPGEFRQLTNLEKLDLSENNIDYWFPIQFTHLASLKYLDVSDNDMIGEIHQALGNLTNLEYISLTKNKLTGNIPASLAKLTNLEYLDLRSNWLSGEIPREIGALTRLRHLDLSANSFSGAVPAEITQLVNLKVLDLGWNDLARVPPGLDGLERLDTLGLDLIPLNQIPPEIWNMTRLKFLSLYSTAIKDLPPEIGRLENLKYLTLGRNELKTIPREIGQLKNLVWLSLNNNQIKGIPKEIGQLHQLIYLILYDNHVEEIPSEIGTLRKLRSLDLTKNRISELPDAIGDLDTLGSIKLGDNKFRTYPSVLNRLKEIEWIELRNNQIEGTLSNEIVKPEKLRYLTLYDNEINGLLLESNDGGLRTQLDVRMNRLTFEDIIVSYDYLKIRSNYKDQKPFSQDTVLTFTPCDDPIIDFGIDKSVANNFYTWIKDGDTLTFTEASRLELNSLAVFEDLEDYSGTYQCFVTNQEEVWDMVLESGEVTIEAIPTCTTYVEQDICLGESLLVNYERFDCQNNSGIRRFVSPFTERDSVVSIRLDCQTCQASQDKIPRAFAPNNGSGISSNETFVIPMIYDQPGTFGVNELIVFNRSRQKVFSQSNYSNGWDGSDPTGNPLPAGTYYYVFKYSGGSIEGTVSIIR